MKINSDLIEFYKNRLEENHFLLKILSSPSWMGQPAFPWAGWWRWSPSHSGASRTPRPSRSSRSIPARGWWRSLLMLWTLLSHLFTDAQTSLCLWFPQHLKDSRCIVFSKVLHPWRLGIIWVKCGTISLWDVKADFGCQGGLLILLVFSEFAAKKIARHAVVRDVLYQAALQHIFRGQFCRSQLG